LLACTEGNPMQNFKNIFIPLVYMSEHRITLGLISIPLCYF